MNEADRKMLEELRDAAQEVQANRGDVPVHRLAVAIERYAARLLETPSDEPEITVETTPATPA